MTREPQKQPGSRRGRGVSYGVGPHRLPSGMYLVEIVFLCSADGTEMGRARRFTAQGVEGIDGETETTRVPGSGGALPRDADQEYSKWRFICDQCGRNVPMSDERVDRMLDEITAPWARRSIRYRL